MAQSVMTGVIPRPVTVWPQPHKTLNCQ